MNTLFSPDLFFPEGFKYFPDFLTLAEEQQLISDIARIALHPFVFRSYEARRRVASFGYNYSFTARTLTKGEPIPEIFSDLIEKVSLRAGISKESFQEVLVTEYPRGSVINWHRDALPFELIAGISLGADCTFRLRPHEKAGRTRASVISLPVRRRSLYIMQQTARWQWEHSTAPVNATRYSITLRTLRSTQATLT